MGNRESVTAPSVKSHLLHLKLGTDLLSSCRKDGFVSTGILDAERPLGRCSKQLMAQWAPSPIPAGLPLLWVLSLLGTRSLTVGGSFLQEPWGALGSSVNVNSKPQRKTNFWQFLWSVANRNVDVLMSWSSCCGFLRYSLRGLLLGSYGSWDPVCKCKAPHCFWGTAGAPLLHPGYQLTLLQLLQESDIHRSLNILGMLLPLCLLNADSFPRMSCPNLLTWKSTCVLLLCLGQPFEA